MEIAIVHFQKSIIIFRSSVQPIKLLTFLMKKYFSFIFIRHFIITVVRKSYSAKTLVSVFILLALVACTKKNLPEPIPDPGPESPANEPPGSFTILLTDLSYDSAKIEWSAAEDPENQLVTYSIFLNDSLFVNMFEELSFTFKNLQPLNNYHVRIVATDSAEKESASLLSFTTNKYFLTYFKQIQYGSISGYSMQSTERMIKGNDGGFIVTGKTELLNQPGYSLKYFAIKLDTSGNEVWRKYYDDDSSASTEANIANCPDGYVIGGMREFMKIDNNGTFLWRKDSYSQEEVILDVAANSTGEIYTVGSTAGDMQNDFARAAISKFDANGNKIWNKTLSPTAIDRFEDILIVNDNEIMILGSTDGNNSSYSEVIVSGENLDYWVVNMDGEGNVRWSRKYADPGYAFPQRIIKTREGNYAFTGFTWRYSYEPRDLFMMMIDNSGNQIWEYFDVNNHTQAHDIAETPDNSLVVAGAFEWPDRTVFSLYKFDKSGNKVWDKIYAEDFTNLRNKSVIPTDDGGYMIATQKSKAYNPIDETDEIYMFKTNENGEWNP